MSTTTSEDPPTTAILATPDAPTPPVAMSAPPGDTEMPLVMASAPALPAPHTLTLEDLENTVRNGKKKLYWSAYEVVLTTRLPSGDQQEMRYDAYQVNHNHLKKIHSGAHGASFVRVECKYCKAPRFTQSITVSTKKFEEHYMTLHALDALASANAKKAMAIKAANGGKSMRNPTTPPRPASISTGPTTTTTGGSSEDEEEDEEDEDDGDEGMDDGEDADATEDDEKDRRGDQDDDEDVEDEETGDTKPTKKTTTTKTSPPKETQKRSRSSPTATGSPSKRARRAALTKDDDDHVAAMQGAAAAVVALSGGPPASAQTAQPAQSSAVPLSMPPPRFGSTPSDSRTLLDPQDSDTKRAKKPYWTAFTIVISERVAAPSDSDDATKAPTASDAAATASTATTGAKDAVVTRETRQDAWRVNHNALRRLHLDASNGKTVRVECRFCHDPKFSQSITVSTRKFEQHYYYEHGDANERQELDQRIARAARYNTSSKIVPTDPQDQSCMLNGPPAPKRRKSWRMLLAEQENPAIDSGSSSTTMAARGMVAPSAVAASAVAGSVSSRGAAMARHQRTQLLQWFVQDAVPLAACESEHFRAFVGSLDRKFEAPSPYTLRMQLTQRHDEIVRAMKTQLRGECDAGTTFALTVNAFTGAQIDRDGEPDPTRQYTQRYVSLSVHFISREWQRQQLLIACRAVPMSAIESTNEQVRGVVASVLDEFGLHADAVFAMTTTNPSNAVGQALQSVACTSNGSMGVRAKKSSSVAVVQLHCAAEALRAVAQAGCHALLRGDTIESLLPVELLWQQDVRAGATPHWMDVYSALSAAVKKQQLQQSSSSFSSSSSSSVVVALRPHELAFALSVVALLEPFARVADDLSRASYPTIAMVFQYFRHLKDTLTQHEELANDALARVVAAMQHTLDSLYDSVMSVDALLAYVLDPRFRLTQISKVDEKRIRAKLEAVAVAQHANAMSASSAMDGDNDEVAATGDGVDGDDNSTGDAAAFAAAHQKPRSLFEELATSSKRTSLGGSTTTGSLIPSTASTTSSTGNSSIAKALVATLAEELEEYLSLDDEEFSVDVLQWWQTRELQLPTLARIARQVLALVGTSLPAQEMFTVVGRQLAARRSVLESDTMDAMVVTRAFQGPAAAAAPLVVADPHATATTLPRGRSPRAMSPAPVATTEPAAPVVPVVPTESMAPAATVATATTTSTTPVGASAKDKELCLV